MLMLRLVHGEGAAEQRRPSVLCNRSERQQLLQSHRHVSSNVLAVAGVQSNVRAADCSRARTSG
eukprot:323393-Lingulodinium_polyedra.AAC.1